MARTPVVEKGKARLVCGLDRSRVVPALGHPQFSDSLPLMASFHDS
jgi:hypothetical protein